MSTAPSVRTPIVVLLLACLLPACLLLACLLPATVHARQTIPLTPGLVIDRSVTITPGTYTIPADSSGAIVIRGSGITVDFNGAVLDGATPGQMPDTFTGTGIRIESSDDITVTGATVRGYKVGLHATDADRLHISQSDFSYNYRQRLKSTIEREHLDDWMSYHRNEEDEWLRYGAAVYVRASDSIRIDHVRVTGGQNGLMLTKVSGADIYNNTITFNSGIGIGLYRSSGNRLRHNRLDWNVRGYSHGVYNRGQDSAAILLYEQSSDNIIAYNSATHSGDGLFLWAGQTTMDTGEGGCNDNLIYGNDFSFAPTNGIEVTFSRNTILRNTIEGCWHGIWGGYSFDTVIAGNYFVDNDEHISIEHGQANFIEQNRFEGGELGVYLWERSQQPADWGYSRNRDVASRDTRIQANAFMDVETPIRLVSTDSTRVMANAFTNDRTALDIRESTVTELDMNSFGVDRPVPERDTPDAHAPAPHPDGMDVDWPDTHPWSRAYILVDEWGPVDFRSPVIWPRSPRTDAEQIFEIVGPAGRWEILDMTGIERVSAAAGEVGDSITVFLEDADVVDVRIRLRYTGERTTDRFGRITPAGEPVDFGYDHFFVPIEWHVSWWNYDDATDPREHYDAFRNLLGTEPAATDTTESLGYQWYGSPADGIGQNHFASRAVGQINVPEGRYRLDLTSDDGVRVWVDGALVHDDWTYHAPRLEQIELDLGGRHEFRIEQFEITGYATLVAQLVRMPD